MTIVRGWFAIALWKRVIAALLLGLLLGALWPQAAPYLQFLGDLFVRDVSTGTTRWLTHCDTGLTTLSSGGRETSSARTPEIAGRRL